MLIFYIPTFHSSIPSLLHLQMFSSYSFSNGRVSRTETTNSTGLLWGEQGNIPHHHYKCRCLSGNPPAILSRKNHHGLEQQQKLFGSTKNLDYIIICISLFKYLTVVLLLYHLMCFFITLSLCLTVRPGSRKICIWPKSV